VPPTTKADPVSTTSIPRSLTQAESAAQFSVENRVIWLTGASGGIGSAVARRLAQGGARLVLQARSADGLAALAGELTANGTEVEVIAGSVVDPAASEEAIRIGMERWGRVDGLVAAAGVSPIFKPAESITLDEWRTVIDVNLTGTFLTATAAGRAMIEHGSGSIVVVSSVHGSVAGQRLAAYSASKGALNMLAKTLAAEWATKGVRVNVLAPGYVETDMTQGLRDSDRWGPKLLTRVPMGRFARPDEIAGATQFLLSDAASYMTGSVVEIDGGWSSQ
jgi:NAD(P)-dependent dehydrogenase (short-subunit alcohol dehydrogenase family)